MRRDSLFILRRSSFAAALLRRTGAAENGRFGPLLARRPSPARRPDRRRWLKSLHKSRLGERLYCGVIISGVVAGNQSKTGFIRPSQAI